MWVKNVKYDLYLYNFITYHKNQFDKYEQNQLYLTRFQGKSELFALGEILFPHSKWWLTTFTAFKNFQNDLGIEENVNW